ncbi:MBL fold metallo-hydrolase [Aureibaculum sp. 2210JD6-5]|uniref:MBL fold metallo-hydrolase n=1 Tax=Aureibaculum sp. 2210JD6-5 TaxID=3103957 RepID=UPI002AAE27D5|nr:MBL fold metallo-hydrolase [Aureibaculum sp. 2210JD6-5]MDY7395612.1 MBL fold metallo-hydrolase [Aureibaculum sp. 2210JD6-5]
MNITFLGTGTSQGIPIIGSNHPVCLSDDPKDKRLRSSIMLEWDSYRFVIDCGPDFRQQMLRAHVDTINGILFTHEHADHTAGLDDIRPFSHKMGNVPLYVPKRIIDNLEQRFYYIFTKVNRYPGAPSAGIQVVENKSFELGSKKVLPVEHIHGKIPIFGYRIDDFAYLTDLKTIEDKEKEKLNNLDILVINALRIEPHPTHLNLEDALNFIEDLQPKKAYLTHISHRLGFHEEVQKQLPENVFLAYDGLKLSI